MFAPNANGWIDPLGLSGYLLRKSMERQNMYRPNSTWQTHHIIPERTWDKFSNFLKDIGMKGKGRGKNSYSNGLYMPSDMDEATKCKRKFFHNSRHRDYTSLIEKRLEKWQEQVKNGDMTKQKALEKVQNLQKIAKRLLSSKSNISQRLG